MCKKEVNEEMAKALSNIIYQFDEENWMKMATRLDLSRYIISKGFCPTARAMEFQNGIRELLSILKDNFDDEYKIIDENGVNQLRSKIYSLIGEK